MLENVCKKLKDQRLLRVVRLVHHGDLVTTLPGCILGFRHYGDAMLFQKLKDGSHRMLLGNFRDGKDKDWLRKSLPKRHSHSVPGYQSEGSMTQQSMPLNAAPSPAGSSKPSKKDAAEEAKAVKKIEQAILKRGVSVVDIDGWSHDRLLTGIADHDCLGYHKCAKEAHHKCSTSDLSSLIVTAPSVWESMIDSVGDVVDDVGDVFEDFGDAVGDAVGGTAEGVRAIGRAMTFDGGRQP